jgi:hypothetical protein
MVTWGRGRGKRDVGLGRGGQRRAKEEARRGLMGWRRGGVRDLEAGRGEAWYWSEGRVGDLGVDHGGRLSGNSGSKIKYAVVYPFSFVG